MITKYIWCGFESTRKYLRSIKTLLGPRNRSYCCTSKQEDCAESCLFIQDRDLLIFNSNIACTTKTLSSICKNFRVFSRF